MNKEGLMKENVGRFACKSIFIATFSFRLLRDCNTKIKQVGFEGATNMCKRRHLGSFVGKKYTEFAYVKSVIWNTDERFQRIWGLFVVFLGPFDFACYTVLVLYLLWNGWVMRYWQRFLHASASESKTIKARNEISTSLLAVKNRSIAMSMQVWLQLV